MFRAEAGLRGIARPNPRYPQLPGSWTVDVRLVGPLWAPGIFSGIMQRSYAPTVAYGKSLIEGRTPVKTGNLKSNWQITERTIFNDEYYANFVEYGTIWFDGYFMATDSTKEIEKRFVQEIQKEIGRTISGKMTSMFDIFK